MRGYYYSKILKKSGHPPHKIKLNIVNYH